MGHRFRVAREAAHNIMAGYHNNPDAGVGCPPAWSTASCACMAWSNSGALHALTRAWPCAVMDGRCSISWLCLSSSSPPLDPCSQSVPLPAVMDGLLSSLDDPALALVQWNEAYAVVADRLPAAVAVELEAAAAGGFWVCTGAVGD